MSSNKDIGQTAFEIIASIIVVYCIIGFFLLPGGNKQPEIQKPSNKPIIIKDTFSISEFRYQLKLKEIKFPEIVEAQARLETGNFTSNYFKNYHNLFGFRGKNGYIKYTTWIKSVEAYAKWQTKYYKNNNEDYFTFLKRINYAEDTNYIIKLKTCIK